MRRSENYQAADISLKPTGIVNLKLRMPREIERALRESGRASKAGMRKEIIALLQQRYCYNG